MGAGQLGIVGTTLFGSVNHGSSVILNLFRDGVVVGSLAVLFGRSNSDGTLTRSDPSNIFWQTVSLDLTSGLVEAADFDEAWLIVCSIGRELGLPLDFVRYGS